MSRESLQPKIEAANNNAAFEVLAANEAAEAAQVERTVESQAAQVIADLMDAAGKVSLEKSDPEAGRAAFEAAREAAAA